MSDYISRAAAVAAIVAIRDELTEKKAYGWEWEYNGLNYAIQALPLPAADVVEVKHGEWIDGLDVPKEERERHPYVYLHGEKYCSVCFIEAYFDTDYGQQLFDYCPNCGAKMDGGAE